jgi:hypothetical protein
VKHHLWLNIVLLVLLAGCAQPSVVEYPPSFVNHPQPDLSADLSDFERAGCSVLQHGRLSCEANSPLTTLGCSGGIRKPSDLWGALEPHYPIVECIVSGVTKMGTPESALDHEVFTERKFMYPMPPPTVDVVVYLIYRDGQFEFIKTEDEFRAIFASIETADEALSYVLALKKGGADYGLKADPKYQYFADTIEDTHVETTENGFLVHLFVRDFCPNRTHAVDVLVTTQGLIKEVRRVPIYEDLSAPCIEL